MKRSVLLRNRMTGVLAKIGDDVSVKKSRSDSIIWKLNKSFNIFLDFFFCKHLAQAFAANCICEIPSVSTRSVCSLYSPIPKQLRKKSQLSRDWNPGLLGEKTKCFFCAMHYIKCAPWVDSTLS